MATIKISMFDASIPFVADMPELGGSSVTGILTTEHARSSYGIPVVVLDDGRVLGHAECGSLSTLEGIAHWARPANDELWSDKDERIADRNMLVAAVAAGYQFAQ